MTITWTATLGSADADPTLFERIKRYLPSNYTATRSDDGHTITISGEDVAGWTMHDYVLPRLASGNMYPVLLED